MLRSLARAMCALMLAIPLSIGLVQPADAATTVLTPDASGTIRSIVGLGVFERAPVGDSIQSSYFNTTGTNREFRRGFFEYTIPACTKTPFRATLTLHEGGGITSFPLPPDTHELGSYMPADLAVTTSDYESGTLFDTFQTDANVADGPFTFDVTSVVSAAGGGTLGFRLKLADDPVRTASGFAGDEFRPTLEIVCGPPTPAEVAAMVDDLLTAGEINSGQANALTASLDAAAASIADGSINAAVNKLKAFINKVKALMAAGLIDPDDGASLIDVAEAIIEDLQSTP